MRHVQCVGLLCVALYLAASTSLCQADPAALKVIKDAGGMVRQVVQDSDELEVEFPATGDSPNETALAAIGKLDKVVALNLRATGVSGAALVHLKELKTLRSLHLEKTALTDEGTEHLAGLVNLEYLNLYGTKVTDKTLAHLSGLKRLRRLYLWQTDVTDDGVAKLQAALPELEINRGVNLEELASLIKEPEPPKPTTTLVWIAANNRDDAPQSKNGPNTQIIFENKSKKKVKLVWVSYDNQLKEYAQLGPGESHQQNSYANNTWLITDESDKPLGYFIVKPEIASAVIPDGI